MGKSTVGSRRVGQVLYGAGIRLPIHRQRIGKRIGEGSLSLSHRHPLAALASQPPTPIVPQCVGGWEVKGWWWDREREEKSRRKNRSTKTKRKKLKRKKRENKKRRQRRSEDREEVKMVTGKARESRQKMGELMAESRKQSGKENDELKR
ncbi:hypothetical protein E3O45_03705 [Cryobacterium sp. TMS1-20-1]|uniref:hypothetical protein n=1 Tax=Cryobacterium sp. TMS1-20-1 TaxID=1259223 RepID=UPI00106C31BD|nr:hypothetical protein [Cryobacterium sp. TMS1-20-1]TFC79396.1 hypothetical protein E3O45_03705 [Cryobacterium sp. TMS1-20-1]